MTVSYHVHCPKANIKLFLHEEGTEVVGIDGGIVISPLFRVDISSSSQGIQFCAKTPRTETVGYYCPIGQ